ncbi:dihydroorotate dehydrogenase electron transfer subunit [Enterococcus italicus]|uniref:dihydroorotate dehydrogenase electron transfer subunit n=1 Tax=Enterococcus italicus TaxID=246144 RepID=UPI002073C74B|nr:dihydroorotate dehydrogenase electron transfer subunit [Enterococcus italicus]MCM6880775.1 dihydroorotate dehydrogenase electron transfer subunit [Enterococcus italicus]
MKQEAMHLVEQVQLAPQIYELTLAGELVKEMNVPGQFLHIKVPREDLILRRPISIHEIAKEKNECKLIYRTEGEGTKVFSELKKGATLDCLGPLGNGFQIEQVQKGQKILVIGGGIGIPPLYELSKQLVKKGAIVTHLFGFTNKDKCYHLAKFAELGVVHVATDDGSYGARGTVATVFPNVDVPDAIYSCGNKGLLQSVASYYENVPDVQLSLEARMACGIGACYACVCSKKESPSETLKVCQDGPVFQASEVLV